MKKSMKVLARALALVLAFAAVFSLTGNREAKALANEPYLYRYLGGTGEYTVGDTITVIYKYSPCYKHEYTYCEMYNSDDKKVGTIYHAWENTSTDYQTWTVNIDTEKLELDTGAYYLKSYVYYKYNYQYITASVDYSYLTLVPGADITLNRDSYKYKYSFLKTSVPKKTLKLRATVTGSTGTVTWASSNENVATVTSKGKVTMLGEGTCDITASLEGASATCVITVVQQTGTEYYKKYIREYYYDIKDCVDEPFEDLEEMRDDCDEALEAALEMKTAVYKVKALKQDSLVRKYMTRLLKYAREADELAWMDDVDVDNTEMISYRKLILSYVKKLNSRVRTLLK